MKFSHYMTATTDIEYKGCVFDVQILGRVISGGSNRWGSDEPEWSDVEITEVNGIRLKNHSWRLVKLSKRLEAKLLEEFGDYFEKLIIERGE